VTRGTRSWRVRLTAAAEADVANIVRWTAKQFGEPQARTYAETLSGALAALMDGPTMPGARARNDIGRGLFTLHVARRGRKGRHFILFRVARDQQGDIIEVLRILHEVMDLPRHVPE
jgi:toxin ParE1/3/4